ncbi:hypothetical protein M4R22_14515 [Acidovorax sp. GBBC 3334]|uniref:hypothetical protein n=1 Tax=unclassified Acidovorax TaxID=2684926 RepID=UPI002303EA4B|nr:MULTISPECIES: hypothetical protein [unclassified Acidovorax]MDA8455983.1 hypothetical protein [Acidovorax sp. GBBC 3334]MDA8523703.1 hypothetical protein [Acidovorax sp. NCPPB 4044]
MHIAGTTAVQRSGRQPPGAIRRTFFAGSAKCLIHKGMAARAAFAGIPAEACVFKGRSRLRSGYQQSYPQKFWISLKSL